MSRRRNQPRGRGSIDPGWVRPLWEGTSRGNAFWKSGRTHRRLESQPHHSALETFSLHLSPPPPHEGHSSCSVRRCEHRTRRWSSRFWKNVLAQNPGLSHLVLRPLKDNCNHPSPGIGNLGSGPFPVSLAHGHVVTDCLRLLSCDGQSCVAGQRAYVHNIS